MTRPLTLVLALIAVAAVGLPGWAVALYRLQPSDRAHPPKAAVAVPLARLDARLVGRFQAMADTACRCTREHGGGQALSACWSGYDRETAPYKSGDMLTLCGDASREWDCFGKDCALTVITDRSPEGLCSDEERRIMAAIRAPVGSIGGTGDPQALDRARTAYKQAYDAFLHGRKVAMPKRRKGAAGGCGAG